MMIPRLLHHTVKDKVNLLPVWRECLATWQEKLSSSAASDKPWEIRIWDDADNDAFVQQEYPQYYDLFRKLPRKINQVDFVRYLYMHKFGGFYADADTKCLRSIEPLRNIAGAQVVLGEYSFYLNKFVECAIMGSVPNHPVWLEMIEAIRVAVETPTLIQRASALIPSMAVMTQTGPLRFTKTIRKYIQSHPDGHGIVLLPQRMLYPNPKKSLPADAFTVHLCNGSWVGGTERGIYELLKNKAVLTLLILTAVLVLVLFAFSLLTNRRGYGSFIASSSSSSSAAV